MLDTPAYISEETFGKPPANGKTNKINMPLRNYFFLHAAASLEGTDDQMLPSAFKAIEIELGFNLKRLGRLDMYQYIFASLFSPVWGIMSDRYQRKYLLACACIGWGTASSLLAFMYQYYTMAIVRALNGIFIGILSPLVNSIIADHTYAKDRGLAFGLMQMSTNFGRVIANVVTTTFAFHTLYGMSGWRLSTLIIGICSILLGIIIFFFMHHVLTQNKRKIVTKTGNYNKELSDDQQKRANTNESSWFKIFRQTTREIFRINTVKILIFEGFVGQIPWNGLSFLTMYYQYCNLSNLEAGLTAAALLTGKLISAPFTGYLTDKIEYHFLRRDIYQRSKIEPRPIIAQISMILRLPFVFYIFRIIPPHRESFYRFFVSSFILGMISCTGTAINKPILSEVIDPAYRATLFSFAIGSEGVCAALLGAPMVALMAEKYFGYESTDLFIDQIPNELRLKNTEALGKALTFVVLIPWSLSLVAYSLLHLTYASDKRKLKEMIKSDNAYVPVNSRTSTLDKKPSNSIRKWLEQDNFRMVEMDSESAGTTE